MGKTRKYSEDDDIDEARKPTFNRHKQARHDSKKFNDVVYSDDRAEWLKGLPELLDES